MTNSQCKIWPDFAANRVTCSVMSSGSFDVLDSPRAGGSYVIDQLAADWCECKDDTESRRVKARLTTWLIDRRLKQDLPPYVDIQRINEMTLPLCLSILDRCERLLRKLGSYSVPIINITQSIDIMSELLAWSESVDTGELTHLISLLQRDGYVHFNGKSISVTETGRLHIQELDDGPGPKIGF